ncbi:MAG: hypothetical protein IIW94_01435 [Clostridia bacterium]|nr:hypothetical protein [Clostridia bacterium]
MLQLKMPGSVVVKSTVKAILKGNRIPSGIVGIIPYLVYLLAAFVAGAFSMLLTRQQWLAGIIFAVLTVLLFAPCFLGAVRWFWRASGDCFDTPSEVFHYFSSFFLYKRAMKCILFLMFKCFTAFFTCLLPYLIVTVISNSWIYKFLGTEVPLWVAGLALVQSFLRVVGIVSALVVISRYYLFPAIFVMDDDMLLLEAIHISVMVSRRSVSSFVALGFSFFGMILLSLFAVPLFYTAPVFFTAYAVHSRFALVNYNQNLDRFNYQQYNY